MLVLLTVFKVQILLWISVFGGLLLPTSGCLAGYFLVWLFAWGCTLWYFSGSAVHLFPKEKLGQGGDWLTCFKRILVVSGFVSGLVLVWKLYWGGAPACQTVYTQALRRYSLHGLSQLAWKNPWGFQGCMLTRCSCVRTAHDRCAEQLSTLISRFCCDFWYPSESWKT